MILHGHSNFSYAVCDFQSMKRLVGLSSLLSKLFCYITWLLYQLIRRYTGRLANEAFTSDPSVSSKQYLNRLKTRNCTCCDDFYNCGENCWNKPVGRLFEFLRKINSFKNILNGFNQICRTRIWKTRLPRSFWKVLSHFNWSKCFHFLYSTKLK